MRTGFKLALALFSLIPLYFAVVGLGQGAERLMPIGDVAAALDNQLRYLSGVYAMVTFMIWFVLMDIDRRGSVLKLLVVGFVIGGLGRLISHLVTGPGDSTQFAGMIIELSTPLFLVWHRAVTRPASSDHSV